MIQWIAQDRPQNVLKISSQAPMPCARSRLASSRYREAPAKPLCERTRGISTRRNQCSCRKLLRSDRGADVLAAPIPAQMWGPHDPSASLQILLRQVQCRLGRIAARGHRRCPRWQPGAAIPSGRVPSLLRCRRSYRISHAFIGHRLPGYEPRVVGSNPGRARRVVRFVAMGRVVEPNRTP